MSIVGTRPPTLDEWNKYELHHRARLAIKPGITGMWQVSGRSEITDFEEVVKLDTEYISEWNVTSDILLSKLGMAKNVLIKKFSKNQYAQLSKVRAEKFDEFSRKQFRLSPKYDSKAGLGRKCKDNYLSVLVGSDQL